MSGTLVYWVSEGENRLRSLRLTLCADEDGRGGSLAELRRKRLRRILDEALAQGARLNYRDLGMIMLASRATLKRDVSCLRRRGVEVNIGRTAGGRS